MGPGEFMVCFVCRSAACIVVLFTLNGALAAQNRAALLQALETARQSPTALTRFHARYELQGGGAVESIAIVTPFRRAVLEAQRSTVTGKPLPTIDKLSEMVARHAAALDVRAVVKLEPLHTYLQPPDYSVVLLAGENRMLPAAVERTALGPRGLSIPATAVGEGVSMVSVKVEARFVDASVEEPGCCRVVIIDPDGDQLLTRTIPSDLR